MNILPKFIILLCLFLVSFFPATKVVALTITSQTQGYTSNLNVWQVIQELGNNLSGTIQSFTFRVSTAASNTEQFDYTAQNTRLYDKDNGNSYISGCVPSEANPNDQLRGLTFTTNDIPEGYQDVTIDFSCRNYNFIQGHRYLIRITNANMAQYGGGRIRFSSAAYSGTAADYFTGGGLRYAYDNGSCNAVTYIWNSSTSNSGCNIWTTKRDDLYFVLEDTTPDPTPTPTPTPTPPTYPVIFIPGIGGSEFQTSQDIFWSADDGHGGTFSHAYPSGEKVWVNENEAAMIGDDDYFDILKLKSDGVTPEASLTLTGNLTPFGYPDIDSFFEGLGFVKNTNFFVYPYDWRKDISTTKDGLDTLVETAKTSSGMNKVNLVAHSMGGLVARNYIADTSKAPNVHKLIELGVPHLGSVNGLKAIMYGLPLGRQIIGDFYIGVAASETKDVLQNSPSAFQLFPSSYYYQFYNNTTDKPYPFADERDIDGNQITGVLNFAQTKTLLANMSYNMIVFNLAETFRNFLDPLLNQTNGVSLYLITGTSQPTLGQIRETWWVNWPITTLPRYEEIYINGDNTVPAYSSALKSDTLDLSAGARLYYVEQKHSDLVESAGAAMSAVREILLESDNFPVEVKDEKIVLEGHHISVDQDSEIDLYDESDNHTGLKANGDPETNITGTFYDSLGTSRNVFIKKSATRVRVKVKAPSTRKTNIKIRQYTNDSVSKTIFYRQIPVSPGSDTEFEITPISYASPAITAGGVIYVPTSEIEGISVLDFTPPATAITLSGTLDSSGNYTGNVTVALSGSDSGSGILKIEYSLDNGQTVQTYTEPFTISSSGVNTLQVKSIDNLGNEEAPQTQTFTISSSSSSTPSTSSASSGSSPNSLSETSSSNSVQSTTTNQEVLSGYTKLANKLRDSNSEEKAASLDQEVFGAAVIDKTSADLLKDVSNPSEWLLLIPAINLWLIYHLWGVTNILFWRFSFRKPTKN